MYGPSGVSELRPLRQVEDENRRLKRLVVDRTLDKHRLSEALRKKSGPDPELAEWFQAAFQVSTVRACRLAQVSRTGWSRRPQRDPQQALWARIWEVSLARSRFGFQRIHVLLRREGWQVNVKRVRGLYRLNRGPGSVGASVRLCTGALHQPRWLRRIAGALTSCTTSGLTDGRSGR